MSSHSAVLLLTAVATVAEVRRQLSRGAQFVPKRHLWRSRSVPSDFGAAAKDQLLSGDAVFLSS